MPTPNTHRDQAERLLAQAAALHQPTGRLDNLADVTAISLLNQRAQVHALLALGADAERLASNQELTAVVTAASSMHGLLDAEDLRAASDFTRQRVGAIVHHGTHPADLDTAQYRMPPEGWPAARGGAGGADGRGSATVFGSGIGSGGAA